MISLYPLIRNEMIKLVKKRRFLVILLILAVLIPVFVYARMKVAAEYERQFGTQDWRIVTEQQVKDYMSRMASPRMPEERRRYLEAEMKRLEYALEKNIDPFTPNAVTFTREFVHHAIGLFLPLLIAVVGTDLVSSELQGGTAKLLLTRPASRSAVLLSKLVALMLFVSLILFLTGLLCYGISGIAFGYRGWEEPVIVGYRYNGGSLDLSDTFAVPQWRYLLMEFGLAWYSCSVVGMLSLMVSVLVRSTAAGMGVMLAALISGMILTGMASSWEGAHYLFMTQLATTDYLAGKLPPSPDLTLSFSLNVLASWAVCALAVTFLVFTKRDILN